MTNTTLTKPQLDLFFSCMRYVLRDTPIEDKTLFDDMESMKILLKFCRFHSIGHLFSYAVMQNGYSTDDNEFLAALQKVRNIEIFYYERMQFDFAQVEELLQREKIPYIPLKGAVMRALYKEPWYRNSCDIDILVKKEDFARASTLIVQELSFEEKERTEHDVSLYSPMNVHLELHFSLIENEKWQKGKTSVTKILSDVWKDAKVKNGCEYQMSDAYFYFYHISHMAKHFECGGCGIRPFLDLWILNNVCQADKEGRLQLLKKAELVQFDLVMQKLSRVWFDGEPYDDFTKEVEKYLFEGGVYGTLQNRVTVQQAKFGGKIGYFFRRLFLTYKQLCMQYPKLEKCWLLYPYYTVKRWFRLLFDKESKERTNAELNAAAEVSKEEQKERATFLQKLGL